MRKLLAALGLGVDWCRRNPWCGIRRFAMFVVAVQIWAWAFDRMPPRANVVGTPNKPTYARGELFEGLWRLTITRRCVGTSSRWLSHAANPSWYLILPSQELAADQSLTPTTPVPIQRVIEVTSFIVPLNAPIDDPKSAEPQAAYHVQIAFRCNPLHRLFPIIVSYPVIAFRIGPEQAAEPDAPP